MAQRTFQHPVFARFYAKVAGPALDKAGIARYRKRLLGGLSGQVIEIGAGNGLNFPHYPPEVKRLLAVEPEPRLRALAEEMARTAPVQVKVANGRAEAPDAGVERASESVISGASFGYPLPLSGAVQLLRWEVRLGHFDS
ncbi:MAG: hypothetical protein LBV34_12885, partial [Nocardiopsaceae bacterium]|nr:hypothetical protein [Nocardiopsaceae bacterium]